LRASWSKKGTSASIDISGSNAKRVIFGAVNIRTGHRIFMEEKRQRQFEFQRFLKLIRREYRSYTILLVLDEDSSHTAKASKKLADDLSIQLEWLPVRCSELNPLETLWGQAKDVVTANWQYESIEEHVDIFLHFVFSMTDREILQTSGILSGKFWIN
jgi:transposase